MLSFNGQMTIVEAIMATTALGVTGQKLLKNLFNVYELQLCLRKVRGNLGVASLITVK